MAIHAQILRKDLVNADVNTKLTLYALQMLDAYAGLQNPGLVDLGEQDSTPALAYKMPISVGEAAWSLVADGFKYRRLGELILPVSVSDYQDGVMADVRKLQSDDWTGWGSQPAKVALGARLIAERALCAAIEAGSTTASVENFLEGDTSSSTIKIFDTSHPCDPLGNDSTTYSNLFTGGSALPLNLANIDVMWQKINTIKAQNGVDYRDLKWSHVLVGKDLEMPARRYFEDFDNTGTIVETSGTSTAQLVKINTARKYGIKVIASPYLTTAGAWHPICADNTGKAPWITLSQIPANQVPLIGTFPAPPSGGGGGDPGFEWIIDALDSELYKHGNAMGPRGHVAIAAKRTVGVGITQPWRIFRCLAS